MNEQARRFLPDELLNIISPLSKSLYELRIRADKPIYANVDGSYRLLNYKNIPIILSAKDIANIVLRACDNSLYAFNDTIKKGYVSKNGIRIGLAGKCVHKQGEISTICDFSSLCIRFPHEVLGCANDIFHFVFDNGSIKSGLIISPPGEGKTTALRDLARIISDKTKKNVLVIDEKSELYSDGFNLGETTDVITGCSKKFGLYNAVRNLCPSVLITDELTTSEDCDGVAFAIKSGVSVIASVHGKNIGDVEKKNFLALLLNDNLLDFSIVIKKNCGSFDILQVKKY